jgi:hypothetical protein
LLDGVCVTVVVGVVGFEVVLLVFEELVMVLVWVEVGD